MRNLHKKTCEWCKKHFFSYEENKIFCTSTCLAKKKYSEMFYLKKPKDSPHPCKECGEEILRESREFCNDICKKKYNKKNTNQKLKIFQKRSEQDLLAMMN